ncbi:hypothetical protein C8R43DRAFT_1143318 [Mycena crocata]|nr:hypothetical protein C8R43DRAFT_1143318 [Mycena crocata]
MSSAADPEPASAAPTALLSYNITTTTTITGLPDTHHYNILRRFRTNFVQDGDHLTGIQYNLACQWYKNIHEVNRRPAPHTDSEDEDQDPPLPPLEDALDPLPDLLPMDASDETTEEGTRDHVHVLGQAYERCPSCPQYPCFSLPPSGWPSGVGFVPASSLDGSERDCGQSSPVSQQPTPDPPRTDCERLEFGWALFGTNDAETAEQEWAAANLMPAPAPQMGPGYRRDRFDEDGPIHSLRIISLENGTQDVQCDCRNGEHSAYTRSAAYAFTDEEGNVIIKKKKTRLIPLN